MRKPKIGKIHRPRYSVHNATMLIPWFIPPIDFGSMSL
jgi:hypothetical protein